MGIEFHFYKVKRVLETDDDDSSATLSMHFPPLSSTVKNG